MNPPRAHVFTLSILAALGLASACGDEGGGGGDDNPLAPVGSVEVRWSFARQDGAPTTCEEVGAAQVYAYVGARRSDAARAQAPDGGEAPPVLCGDPQSETWTQLVEATLPVFIEVRTASGGVLTDFTGTVRVVPQRLTTVEHTFSIAGTGPSQGDLRLTWNIDGQPAAQSCARVGATTVALATRSGSIADFSRTAPCADGGILLEDLRIGGYIIRAELRDAQGAVLSLDEQDPIVRADTEVSDQFRFNISSLERARVHARWTIEGRDAATACEEELLSEVEVQLQRLNPADLEWITVETATAACADGALDIEEVNITGQPRLELLLFEDILGDRSIVTSTATDPFPLQSGQTATVTGDFRLLE